MLADLAAGLTFVVLGVVTVRGRHGEAKRAAKRAWFWMAKEIDEGAYAWDYGVIGCVFVLIGIVILVFRPFSR